MQEKPARLTASPAFSRSALRIVLFGMPDAGKSSLLGALAQAAQTQEDVLNGRLTDLSQGLAELQRRLYEEMPRKTLEEVVPYPVAFEPLAGAGQAGASRLEAILVDCDGRVANELLSRRRSFSVNQADGSLAQAILLADTLVLAIDASAPPAQIDADFAEFGRFLRLLEQSRGQRTDISGLPVFLVLTKCDLLVQPAHGLQPLGFAGWMERIEERKREVARRFENFLAGRTGAKPMAFGSIDLHVWATAVKRPPTLIQPSPLGGEVRGPREPYGVAELFRQCLESAPRFRHRQDRSSRRLLWTAAATVGVLVLLAGLAATLLLRSPTLLEAQVDRYQTLLEQEQSPAARHRDLNTKIEKLTAFADDPDFARLPPSKQDYIRGRLKELTGYRNFENKLYNTSDPKDARDLEELQQIRTGLAALKVPDEYEAEWQYTPAGLRLVRWREDADVLGKAVKETTERYQKLIEDGKKVLDHAQEANLPQRAKEVLQRGKELPEPKNDKDKPVRGSRRVTYGTVFGIAEAQDVYQKWEETKKRLEPAAKL